MANKLILKRSNVAGKIPTAAQLEIGELSVNFADQLLFTKEPGGTVVKVGDGTGSGGSTLPANAAGVLTNDGTGTISWTPVPVADWPTITNTPTTIAGYGITDALVLGNTGATAAAGNHNHDNAYYRKPEFLKVSAGAASSDHPILLNASGKIDGSMLSISGGMRFVGSVDPASMPATPKAGDFVIFNKAGTVGTTPVKVGDMGVYDGAKWDAIENAADMSAFVMKDGTSVMTGNFNAGAHKVVNVKTPTANADAATKYYVDHHHDATKLSLTGGAITGNVSSTAHLTLSSARSALLLTGIKGTSNKMLYISSTGEVRATTMPYTVAQNDARYLKLAGGTLTGNLTATKNVAVSGVMTLTGAPSAYPLRLTGMKTTHSQMLYLDTSGRVRGTTMPYTLAQNDARYLKLAGGTVTGAVTLNTSPQIVSGSIYGGLKYSGGWKYAATTKNVPWVLSTATGGVTFYVAAPGTSGRAASIKPVWSAHTNGLIYINSLAGTGTRMVVAAASGGLTTAALPKASVGSRNQFAYFSATNTVHGTAALTMASSKRLIVAAGYKVGIGIAPTQALQVAGNIYASGIGYYKNDLIAFYSDDRLKDRTGTIDSALAKVNSLDTFTYKPNKLALDLEAVDADTAEKSRVGVSAQQMQAVLPEAVCLAPFDTDANGGSISGDNYLTVQSDKVIPLLIAAVQELTAKVEVLENADH